MRVGVVGAGLAGLMAAGALQSAGHDVVVLERSRSPGGRLATRRIGPATLDHGAQFFTVRTAPFAEMVERWQSRGLVRVWCRGFGPEDGHPRYVAEGGMNAVAKHVAADLAIRFSTMAFALRPSGDRPRTWSIGLDDGGSVEADAAIVTCPLPQSASLLITAGVELPDELRRCDYDRTLALLCVLDRPSAVPAPGGVPEADDTFSFVGDNQAKGVSPAPAVTFHARPSWSLRWWDRAPAEAHAELLGAARPWLGDARVVESQLKRWRFATPQTIWPERCWSATDGAAPLVLAGDAFGGPRVEGAALSGLAAAQSLIDGPR